MEKPIKLLLGLVALLAALAVAGWLLLGQSPQEEPGGETEIFLVSRTPDEVWEIRVENLHGGYTFRREEESFTLHDLPLDRVNEEYVAYLLDESSRIRCLSLVTEDLSRLADFGLASPEATVEITYSDGASMTLLVGAQESVSGERYCMEQGGQGVYLMKNNRTIRFTMPVEKYLQFIIIPPEESTSALSVLQDISFSGTSLPQPIDLKAVLPQREDTQIQALAYGAVTHILTRPGVHEADPGALQAVAQDLLGLLSEGIVDYNCTPEELAGYGFDEPWLQIDFDYKNGKDAPVEPYCLRVMETDQGYIATVNDQGIVYRILDLPFLHITYEDLVLRWFLSPFLTDVAALELTGSFGGVRYDLTGEHAKDLSVTRDGQPVDAEAFRKFYNLVVSAALDGPVTAQLPALEGEPLLKIRYLYRNEGKEADVLELYQGPQRRLYASVNGVCEFTMRGEYLNVVEQAVSALERKEPFATDW